MTIRSLSKPAQHKPKDKYNGEGCVKQIIISLAVNGQVTSGSKRELVAAIDDFQ